MNKTLKVQHEEALLAYLFTALPDTKKTVVKQRLKHGCVSVNGRIQTRFDHLLVPGDEIRIESSKSRAVTPALQFNIEIIYEDDCLLVINKPAGLLSIATEKIQRETAIYSVNDYLNKKAAAKSRRPQFQKRVFIVHRLDRDVSGLLVLAKSEAVKLKLQENWDRFKKEYLAVVEGAPREPSGTCSSYLNENKFLRVFSSSRPVTPEAKKAVTHYEVLKSGEKYSLLKIRLETGRKHQIRVHLSDLGHPVAGDKNYNAWSNPIRRIALHAWRLEFKHPVTGKDLVFTCPLPPPIVRLTE
ncbi:MAG: RluA family pseudouridine synthase [Candidatus Omnitrophica bacterium]|nr:RluA family pseudouridine synthase [Candidatus Omnitrophota bacterium]